MNIHTSHAVVFPPKDLKSASFQCIDVLFAHKQIPATTKQDSGMRRAYWNN